MTKISQKSWKSKLHDIIYETDTPAGKLFDVILLITIIASIILVMLESIKSFDTKFHDFLNIAEWIITILFSFEYCTKLFKAETIDRFIVYFKQILSQISQKSENKISSIDN